MIRLRVIFTLLILTALLVVGTFGVAVVTDHNHVAGCPFMPGEQAMCPMSTMDHIALWQSKFAATETFALTLLVLAAVCVFFLSKYELISIQASQFVLHRKNLKNRLASLFQELFSQGILNPKTF